MRILHTVESYLPSRHGMSEVVRQISERLVLAGHQVTVATRKNISRGNTSISGVEVREFDISGNMTIGIRGEYDRYIQFLLESDFDIVTNFSAQHWATDLALPLLSKIKGKKVFVPTGFSALKVPGFKSYFERMKDWLKEYNKVVYHSDDYRDVNFARDLGLKNGVLIPNGASEEEFSAVPDPLFKKQFRIPEQHGLILHVASYVGGKGHLDAIRIFLNARLKQATLLFVSPAFGQKFEKYRILASRDIKSWLGILLKKSDPFEYMLLVIIHRLQKFGFFKHIRFMELPRDQVIQAYINADLFLFPSNIECSPIVLFECMAARLPFLVTDVGNAKEIITWSGSGKLLHTNKTDLGTGLGYADVSKSSKLLRSIVEDPNERKRMAESGYDVWKENFTWMIIADKYEKLYRDITSTSNSFK